MGSGENELSFLQRSAATPSTPATLRLLTGAERRRAEQIATCWLPTVLSSSLLLPVAWMNMSHTGGVGVTVIGCRGSTGVVRFGKR